MKRVVRLNVLPGEPLDGSGRICIHLFVRDPGGVFVEPHVLHLDPDSDVRPPGRKFGAGPARGRLACDRRRAVAPVERNGVTTITVRTDDPRAVTCPKCMASAEYSESMSLLGS